MAYALAMSTNEHTLEKLRSGQLAGLERLDLSCGLSSFPPEIFELANTLQVLNLSSNQLSSLPDDMHRLHQLEVLFCSDNLFTTLPGMLGQCKRLSIVGFKANQITQVPAASLPPALRWLILTDNRIAELPPEINRCTLLQKLMLAGNRLQSLPAELADCKNLALLRVSANDLSALPTWLADLPKLAWLGYAGQLSESNARLDKVSDASEVVHAAPIAWQHLQLARRLGEGASGVIYQAVLSSPGIPVQNVAVKLFKGTVTSDGWPRCELAANLAAGAHPNLMTTLGPLDGHPNGTAGLVMHLLPPSYRTLAAPPSLQSCTRDVYPADAVFELAHVWRTAWGAASAAAHLHANGLLHGDLYAHNLQCTAGGDCLLGDMGAASFLPSNPSDSQRLQRLEVRAFGVLLAELLSHSPVQLEQTQNQKGAGLQAARSSLMALADVCLQLPAKRPLFAGIVRQLQSISSLNQ